MMKLFEMTNLGFLNSYLGIEVTQIESEITFDLESICIEDFEAVQNGRF